MRPVVFFVFLLGQAYSVLAMSSTPDTTTQDATTTAATQAANTGETSTAGVTDATTTAATQAANTGETSTAGVTAVGYQELCAKTSECDTDKGLECLFQYSTCPKGRCDCPDGQTYRDDTCKKELFIDDVCTGSNDIISVPNAVCTGTTVACSAPNVRVSTSFCKASNEAALGEACNGGETCYVYGDRIPATTSSTSCQGTAGNKTCVCSAGYITDENTATMCRQKTVDDPCLVNTDCKMGNQECLAGKCKCVAQTELVDGQCQAPGELAEETECTSGLYDAVGNKATTCSFGLLCQNCPGETAKKCLKITVPTTESPTTTTESAGTAVGPAVLTFLTAFSFGILGMKMI